MELLTAVVLFGIILASMQMMETIPVASSPAEVYEQVWLNMREGDGEGEDSLPEKYQIKKFKILLQDPELPTGCEITSMTMVLNYYGMDVDKITMATDYLSSVPAEFSYSDEGDLYGPDIERHFVGDPATENGYVCGAEAIRRAADKYLRKIKSPVRAANETGVSADELYRWVSRDIPVVVWVTINMEERNVIEGWYTDAGGYVDWGSNDHGAVLIGYTSDTVTIADPIAGKVIYERKSFEDVFVSRGSQCVILEQ